MRTLAVIFATLVVAVIGLTMSGYQWGQANVIDHVLALVEKPRRPDDAPECLAALHTMRHQALANRGGEQPSLPTFWRTHRLCYRSS